MAKFKYYIVLSSGVHVAHRISQRMGWPEHVHQGTAYVMAESKPKAAALILNHLGSNTRPRDVTEHLMNDSLHAQLLPYTRENAILVMRDTVKGRKVFRADDAGLTHVATWRYDERKRAAERLWLEPVESTEEGA